MLLALLIAYGFPSRQASADPPPSGLAHSDAKAETNSHPFLEARGPLAFSPDGKTLVTSAKDGTVRIWDVKTLKEVLRLPLRKCIVHTLAISGDGGTIASVSDERVIHAWDSSTGKEVATCSDGEVYVDCMAFSPEGHHLAWGGPYTRLQLWDARKGKLVRQFEAKDNAKQTGWASVAFSPDGKMIAGGPRFAAPDPASVEKKDCQISLWEADSGKLIRQFGEKQCAMGRGVRMLAFSPDGSVLAATFDDDILIFDVGTGQLTRRLKGPQGAVFSLAISPDGKLLASCDGRVRMWEMVTGKEIRQVAPQGKSLAFSPDGKRLAIGEPDPLAGGALGAGVGVHDLYGAEGLFYSTRYSKEPLTDKELKDLWADLAGEDVPRAYEAVTVLALARERSLPFLKDRLKPVAIDEKRPPVNQLIADLDREDFEARDQASRELRKLGPSVKPALRKALESKPSEEARRRIKELLDQPDTQALGIIPPETLRVLRALIVLERIGDADATDVVRALSKGDPYARLTREAKAALERLSR